MNADKEPETALVEGVALNELALLQVSAHGVADQPPMSNEMRSLGKTGYK